MTDHGDLYTRYLQGDQEAARVVEVMAGRERAAQRAEAAWLRPVAPDGTDTCPVCWTSHGCDLPRGHPGDHLCLEYSDALPDQNGGSWHVSVAFYTVCSRSPVGAPGNFMADYADRSTLFGPEVINDQDEVTE